MLRGCGHRSPAGSPAIAAGELVGSRATVVPGDVLVHHPIARAEPVWAFDRGCSIQRPGGLELGVDVGGTDPRADRDGLGGIVPNH